MSGERPSDAIVSGDTTMAAPSSIVHPEANVRSVLHRSPSVRASAAIIVPRWAVRSSSNSGMAPPRGSQRASFGLNARGNDSRGGVDRQACGPLLRVWADARRDNPNRAAMSPPSFAYPHTRQWQRVHQPPPLGVVSAVSHHVHPQPCLEKERQCSRRAEERRHRAPPHRL